MPQSPPDHLHRRFVLGMVGAGAAMMALPWRAMAATRIDPALDRVFEDHGLSGCFVAMDAETGRLTLSDAVRCRIAHVPASSFKIANSLIALDTGAVHDEAEIIPYGGGPQPIAAWAHDMSMRDAIRVSNVPVYQQLARRIGIDRYHTWLERFDYGNRQIGADVARFWLDGPLRISPVEQARFLARLACQQLPASPRHQHVVRDMLWIETKNGRCLYAKTGFTSADGISSAWWVGWVEHARARHAFALHVLGSPMEARDARIALGRALLARLKLY